ncbi:MAG: hypothetical protein A2157_07140 [Deltaproteobacteria bacterium RBG_16_47_11]|nr:MAG: hypothetical protein A2157_07140 [Deltaproteobacteria bacterium RBG_16_47_11]
MRFLSLILWKDYEPFIWFDFLCINFMGNLRVTLCLNLESLKLKENEKTLQCFLNHLHIFLFDISTTITINVNISTNQE